MGQAAGVAVDAQDHIWVVQRPKSLTDDERGATLAPPRSLCCVPAPPVLQFDAEGNLLQAWGGPGAGYEWLLVEGIDENGFAFSNDYGGFGAQALAGLNIMMSPTVGLYGEGVYNWTNVEADFFDPVYGVGVHESVDYDGWAAHAGLKFRF